MSFQDVYYNFPLVLRLIHHVQFRFPYRNFFKDRLCPFFSSVDNSQWRTFQYLYSALHQRWSDQVPSRDWYYQATINVFHSLSQLIKFRPQVVSFRVNHTDL